MWTNSATAQNTLTLTLDPAPLTEKGKITVADPNNAGRQFDPGKFKVTEDPKGVVKVTAPTQANAPFEVTPLKSGSTTLTIKYEDGQTVLEGKVTVVVPYAEARIQGARGEAVKKGEPLKLISGQSIRPIIIGKDLISKKTAPIQATLKSNNSDTVGFDNNNIVAQNVTGTAQATISVEVAGIPYDPINVQVDEAIDRIEVVHDGITDSGTVTLPIPEGETKDLKVRIVGVNGTVYKPSDFASTFQLPVGEPEPNNVPFYITRTLDGDTIHLTAANLSRGSQGGEQDLELLIPGRGKVDPATGNPTDALTTIEAVVVQKAGSIRLTTGPTGPTLIQNGRVTINAEVRDRSGAAIIPAPDVTFAFKNPTKDSLWFTLVTEGNQATVVWKTPTEDEIKAANNNQLVPRPSDVVVTARTRLNADSPEITSDISISVGEIRGFDFLKIKLNVMDSRTAADLYGKVTSDEYYVLTVRLFNDLRDQKQQITGESILAYSSSIELAVGLEKKFDKDSDSFFSGVISKGEAERLVRVRSQKALELANTRVNDETAAIQSAQADLTAAITEAYNDRQKAITLVNDAIEKRVIAEKSIELAKMARTVTGKNAQIQAANAQAQANKDINNYNNAFIASEAALERARASGEKVEKLREIAARAAASHSALNPDITSYFDSDIAIDDGKWHPISRTDLNRIAPQIQPAPLPDAGGLALLPPLTDSGLRATATPTPTPVPSPSPTPSNMVDKDEAPCVGVITYRPFTFEMMVNTVDRREERSTRSRIFKVLDFVGTTTSFVTSIAVPGSSSDLPLGLEKYRNLLIPGLDRLYPNYKEQQRQNIVSQAMKEIEEIPFGSDITRVIFVPKKVIHGLVRGHDVRISEICPYFFKIQVALVTKKGVSQQGSIAPQ